MTESCIETVPELPGRTLAILPGQGVSSQTGITGIRQHSSHTLSSGQRYEMADYRRVLGTLYSAKRWYLTGSEASCKPKAPHILTNQGGFASATSWQRCEGAVDFPTICKQCKSAAKQWNGVMIGFVSGLEHEGFVFGVIDIDDHNSDSPPVLLKTNTTLTQLGESLVARFVDVKSDMLLVSRSGKGIHLPLWFPKEVIQQLPKTMSFEDNHSGRTIKIDLLLADRFVNFSFNFINMSTVGHSTEDKILNALEHFNYKRILGRSALQQTDTQNAVPLGLLDAPTTANLQSALQAVPSDDRDLWIRFGLVLKHFGEVGWQLWHEWSKKGKKYRGIEDCQNTWDGLKPNGDIKIGSIFWEAQQRGWCPSVFPILSEGVKSLPDLPLHTGASLPGGNSAVHSIPTNYKSAAAKLAQHLWAQNKADVTDRLIECITSKNYQTIADHLCENLGVVGGFRQSGTYLCLEGKSRWGSKIFQYVGLSKEHSIVFAERALNELCRLVLCDEQLKAKLKKSPTTSVLEQVAETVWKATLCGTPSERQPANLIVYQNGVLDLTSGKFTEDLRAPLAHSHPIAANWNFEIAAKYQSGASIQNLCPVFAGYLQDWLPDDQGTITLLLRWFGYSMTTDASRQKFLFLYGPTGAGKGSLCQTLCGLVGEHNCVSLEYWVLEGGFRAAEMHDKLVITIEEVEGNSQEHDVRMATLKKFTGGERVQFEKKYRNPFEDSFIGKFILQSNKPLSYQDKGGAIQRRMIAVGFERSYSGDSPKTPSQVILEAEADAIATVAGLAWYHDRDTGKPFEIEGSRALQLGRREIVDVINPIQKLFRFVTPDPGGRIAGAALMELCEIICRDHGMPIPSRVKNIIKKDVLAKFTGAKATNHVPFAGKNVRGYEGIGLDTASILEEYPDLQETLDDYNSMPHLLSALGLGDDRGPGSAA